jgi:hypothetical protein
MLTGDVIIANDEADNERNVDTGGILGDDVNRGMQL